MSPAASPLPDHTRFLVIGAGVSGLAFAGRVQSDDVLVVEAEAEIGGYCRTISQDGFVWDYSGHFFHFKHPEIEAELVAAMEGQRILKVEKVSWIRFGDRYVDFPFQKNIHQLPEADFLDCLHGLVFRDEGAGAPCDFKDMLYRKLGAGIAERFLIPYNTKLYATDLATLDPDAMGRFFPHASLRDIVGNFKRADNTSYNATFTYPEGGAIQYVHALARGTDPARIRTSHRVVSLDLPRRVATVAGPDGARHEVAYEHVISSAPFPRLLEMARLHHDPAVFTANKVLVFNLGFDRKGPPEPHWIYYGDPEISFYRVGFYDNIFGTDRMSIYVEIGLGQDAPTDPATIDAWRERVLADLARVGVVTDHRLLSHVALVLDPAYVHITGQSAREVRRLRDTLSLAGVHSIGRYGAWTYCSIEDNIVEARELADRFNATLGA
jgi:protoporphyrinogen oxidase